MAALFSRGGVVGMRPKGEAHLALMEAARVLATPDRGATLRELAARACVGRTAARCTLNNLVRSRALVIVRTRRVAYRNRPVAEYALPDPAAVNPRVAMGVLTSALSAWHTCSSP